ncbi:MAG: hypothetical protein JWM33_253 [Caulobacteraceae bacterium]|nr:hypothetical protein [Caulobacteraceae bacterium]
MNRRAATLEGALAAEQLHAALGSRLLVSELGGGIDVFGAILQAQAMLLFRPLEGLLGFCIRGPDGPGVVISTQRPLKVQRFTGAHELGHVMLGHTLSLDGPEILARGGQKNDLETAADSFASSFLLPKWLLQVHARRQGWNRSSMEDPRAVYQLSLRAGASFTATCAALARHKIIDENISERLIGVPRRKIKAELLSGLPIESFHPDVWVLNERDEGMSIQGHPDDLFILRLRESGGAGYLWNAEALVASGFAVLRDERHDANAAEVGGAYVRSLTVRTQAPHAGALSLELRRPWVTGGEPASALHVTYELYGKEVGMPRAQRRQVLAA